MRILFRSIANQPSVQILSGGGTSGLKPNVARLSEFSIQFLAVRREPPGVFLDIQRFTGQLALFRYLNHAAFGLKPTETNRRFKKEQELLDSRALKIHAIAICRTAQAEPAIQWAPRRSLGTRWGRLHLHRSGTTLAELLVTATLLITGLTLISQGAVQTQRIWQATRHHQLALDELANQVDRLTAMKPIERTESLASLLPSESIRAILDNPTLKGEAVSDEDGDRIVLSMEWDRVGPAIPVTLVGWIPPSSPIAIRTEDDL